MDVSRNEESHVSVTTSLFMALVKLYLQKVFIFTTMTFKNIDDAEYWQPEIFDSDDILDKIKKQFKSR